MVDKNEIMRLAECVKNRECKEIVLGRDIYIYDKNRRLLAIISSEEARKIYRRIVGHPSAFKIIEVPLDSFTELIINFDPRFQTLEINHLVGEDNKTNEMIARKIANKMGGEIHKTSGLIYVTIPWRPEIYHTLGDEVREIYRIK